MSIDKPNYDGQEREMWSQSLKEVFDEIHPLSGRLEKRVSTFIDRFGYDFDAVVNKISEDNMFAAHFAKEPRRTGFHEKLAATWIENNIKNISNFSVLPKGGANALKVTSDGNIESETKNKKFPGKSLDFQWKVGIFQFYCSHKYTKEGGGNQDSQYKEVVELMKRFQQCQLNNVVLVVIVDGQYYNASENKRLNELVKLEKDRMPKSFAIQIQDLQNVISQFSTIE